MNIHIPSSLILYALKTKSHILFPNAFRARLILVVFNSRPEVGVSEIISNGQRAPHVGATELLNQRNFNRRILPKRISG